MCPNIRYTQRVVNVAFNLKRLAEEIQSVACACGRSPSEVRLLAVSKTISEDHVQLAQGVGQRLFGENRVQEAACKIPRVHGENLEWHLIGPLQSNKAQSAVELFDVIQTLDRTRIVHRVNRCAEKINKFLPVFIEVNIGEESQKHGVPVDQLPTMVELIDSMPHLALQGLMSIPPYQEEAEASRPYFQRMFQLLQELNRGRPQPLRELSMGMTHDFRVAIQEGATLVRVGTAIFGPRSK